MMRPWLKSDYGQYSQWFIARALTPPPQDCLPPIGVIIDNVAAGFLVKTDAKVAMIEHVVTNPRAESELREQALNEINDELSFLAKKAGFKYLYGDTNFKEISDRAHRYGFKSIGKFDHFIKEL